MDVINTKSFSDMTLAEMQTTDGGFAVSVTVALIALGGTALTAGFAAGITVGLNRKNRK